MSGLAADTKRPPVRDRGLWAALGPGLLWAGTAVGVSHLVQSTRAGADFGLGLLWVVVAANLLKYPAFEAAPRWTAATGRSLLEGYRLQGRWTLVLFLLLTGTTMFTVLGAVTIVSAGMASALLGGGLSPPLWAAFLLLGTGALLAANRFRVLDSVMKVMMITLTLSTLACVAALPWFVRWDEVPIAQVLPIDTAARVGFLVALIGWMPTAIDIAVWQSLWSLEKDREAGAATPFRWATWDFNIGYVGTTLLAIAFLAMGAGTLYGGDPLPEASGAFASRFVQIYVSVLGEWSRPFILVAAFSTMLSTTITVADGFPRALDAGVAELRSPGASSAGSRTSTYWAALALAAVGALALITWFQSNFKALVDLATTLSFLTAPMLAWLNYKVLLRPEMPPERRPGRWFRAFHVTGIVFMAVFALYFCRVILLPP